MKKERIVTRRWGDRRKGKTDWARFDAMTDEEVEASIANDPDWAEFKDIDWSDAVLVIPARKKRSRSALMRTCSTSSGRKARAINAASTRCCAPTCSRRSSRRSGRDRHRAPDAALRESGALLIRGRWPHNEGCHSGMRHRTRVYPSSAISLSKSATADLDAQTRYSRIVVMDFGFARFAHAPE